MGVSIMVVAFLARIFVRRFINMGWTLDDTMLAVATGIAPVQSSLLLTACSDGLGSSIKLIAPEKQVRVQQLYYASNLLYLWALDLSRASSLLFIQRLSAPGSNLGRYCKTLIALLPVSTVAFTLAVSLQCGLSQPWVMVHAQCSGWFLRWEIQAAIACLLEIAVFAAPVWLVWNLQQPLETKMEITTSFALRLLVLVATGMRLGTFSQAGFATDPILHEARYICWTQVEMSYSVIAATFPTAHRLVLDLITLYNGGQFGSGASRTRSGTGGDTYQMRPLPSTRPGRSAQISTKSLQGGCTGDNESEEMIIRKDVNIEVRREPGVFKPGKFE